MDFKGFELGPKMLALSERERAFVWYYVIEQETQTEAARKAGYADNGSLGDNAKSSIRVRAHDLMHRERVLEAIDEVGRQAFRGLLAPAIAAVKRIIENPKHPDHSKVVAATLNRLGLVEKTGVEVSVNGTIAVNHTDAAVSDLKALRELGVSREKLIEMFGFSGLSRYEKMLDEREGRAPRGPLLIEGEVVKDGTD